MAYVCVLDELERQVAANTFAAHVQRALGAEVDIPDWYTIREEFDAELARPLVVVEQSRMTLLMRAMGLR